MSKDETKNKDAKLVPQDKPEVTPEVVQDFVDTLMGLHFAEAPILESVADLLMIPKTRIDEDGVEVKLVGLQVSDSGVQVQYIYPAEVHDVEIDIKFSTEEEEGESTDKVVKAISEGGFKGTEENIH